jgi:hypothetical protein
MSFYTSILSNTNPDNPQFLYTINSSGAPTLRPGGTPLQAGDIWNDLDYGIARTYTGTEWRSPGVYDNNTAFSVGSAVLATTATTGFLYIPSCAGAPTGVPVVPYTGAIAMVYDSTNNRLYLRNGATWFKTAALT